MKKFTTLLCTLLAAAGLTGASASAWTVKVNIDDASHVTCVDEDYEPVALVTGENVFNGDSWSTYYFTVVEPYEFKSIVNDDNGYSEYFYDGRWTGTFGYDQSFTITTYNAEEARTATASITVTDDASNVVAYREGGMPLELTAGTPTSFKFNPETENIFNIKPKENGTALYKVTVDGQDKTADSYGEYRVLIENGSDIQVQAKFPDLPATLTFSYNSGSENCISNVKLNNQLVEDFDGKTLVAKLGDKISFEKTKNWNISSFTVNDANAYIYSEYSGIVTGDMAFKFIAQYEDPNITVKLNIDDASHVKVKQQGSSEYFDIVSGDNVLKLERYSYLEVEPVAPWALDEIYDLVYDEPVNLYGSTWSKYISPYSEYDFKITTYNVEESRTASMTVNVDEAAKVLMRRQSDGSNIALEDGANIVKFNPEKETEYTIMPSGNAPLYEVKLNGDKLTASYGSYNVTVSNGNTLDITAAIPDVPVTCSFSYKSTKEGEDVSNCISTIKVDGETVEDFDGKILTIKMGQKITISFDKLYSIDSFVVNGESAGYYGYGDYTSTNLMGDTNFEVTAHKLGTVKATIKVDDPTNLIFATGGYSVSYGSTKMELTAGDNEIELPENNTQVCWGAANGCFIESVELNGVKQAEYVINLSLKEGDVLSFTTGKIVYDMSAIVWIDNKDAASFFEVAGSYPEATTCEVTTGYSEIAFRQSMNPIVFAWAGEGDSFGKLYLNGELKQSLYSGSNRYELPLETGDVVKIFLSTEPVTNTVTFDIEEGLEVSATTDRVTPVEDLTAPLKVYGGTEVALTVNSDEQLVVMNGETAMTPDEDGKYVATVSADTKISVKKFVKGDFSVALNETEITLVEEETKTLTATFTKGDDVTVAQQGFTSSDEAVATVSAGGLVTAVAKGEATITFTATDNYERTVTATCKVTVTEKSGILEIEANGAEGVIFDLQGRRVNKAAKGFYIINGQKVIR